MIDLIIIQYSQFVLPLYIGLQNGVINKTKTGIYKVWRFYIMIFLLVLSLALGGYLVYALAHPEKF